MAAIFPSALKKEKALSLLSNCLPHNFKSIFILTTGRWVYHWLYNKLLQNYAVFSLPQFHKGCGFLQFLTTDSGLALRLDKQVHLKGKQQLVNPINKKHTKKRRVA
jgi:hypothetical protein